MGRTPLPPTCFLGVWLPKQVFACKGNLSWHEWGAVGDIPVLRGCGMMLLATQEQLLDIHRLSVSPSASASPVPPVPASFLLPASGSVGSLGPSALSPTHQSLFHISSPPFQHPIPFPRLAFWSPALSTQNRSYPVPRATCRPGPAGWLQSGPPQLSAHLPSAYLCRESTQPWRQGVGWPGPLQARCCLHIGENTPTHTPVPVGARCTG